MIYHLCIHQSSDRILRYPPKQPQRDFQSQYCSFAPFTPRGLPLKSLDPCDSILVVDADTNILWKQYIEPTTIALAASLPLLTKPPLHGKPVWQCGSVDATGCHVEECIVPPKCYSLFGHAQTGKGKQTKNRDPPPAFCDTTHMYAPLPCRTPRHPSWKR